MGKLLFTSESVTEGHPDKACDAFSDAILDSILEQDNEAHVACESLATKGLVVISGEVRTDANIDTEKVVKDTIREIGYNESNSGVDPSNIEVLSKLHSQSPEIAQGVDSKDLASQGAGDQGLMFGYAVDETPELMPAPLQYSQAILKRLSTARRKELKGILGPDSKSQLTISYKDGEPDSVKSIVVSTQHLDEKLTSEDIKELKEEGIETEVIPWINDQEN